MNRLVHFHPRYFNSTTKRLDLGAIPQERLMELLEQKNNEKRGASASGQRVVPISEAQD
jgi:hypothetical protein